MNVTLSGANGNQTKPIENENIRKIMVEIFFKHGTLNTVFASPIINLKALTLKGVLCEPGKDEDEIIIFNSTLDWLGAGTGYMDTTYNQVQDPLDYFETVAPGAAAYAQGFKAIVIQLPHTLNVTKGREFRLSINYSSALWSAQLSTADCYLTVTTIEDEDISEYIPIIRVDEIPQAQPNWTTNAGDNVVEVVFVNLDKYTSPNLSANHVVTATTFKADEYSKNLSANGLFVERVEKFMDQTNCDYRGNSFRIAEGSDLDGVKIDFSLTAANVNAGQNAVVVARGMLTSHQVVKAIRRDDNKQTKSKQKMQRAVKGMKV